MPAEDYASATTGTLKLKGVQNSKISKKKKRPKPAPQSSSIKDSVTSPLLAEALVADKPKSDTEFQLDQRDEKEAGSDAEKEDIPLHGRGKTEAEIRHDERRRKRLDERLKREGTKTHKERVEELNRYLSNLSEHHDMPRIGPG